jgi:hypothetical protein
MNGQVMIRSNGGTNAVAVPKHQATIWRENCTGEAAQAPGQLLGWLLTDSAKVLCLRASDVDFPGREGFQLAGHDGGSKTKGHHSFADGDVLPSLCFR